MTVATRTRTLTCSRCTMQWQRPSQRGRLPKTCPACRTVQLAPRPKPPAATDTGETGRKANRIDTEAAAYRLAHAVTAYRLAIEEATGALRLNRPADALHALERVTCPTRVGDRRGRTNPA